MNRARPGIEHHVEASRLRLERRAPVLRRIQRARALRQRQVAEGGDVPRQDERGPVRQVDGGPLASVGHEPPAGAAGDPQ